MCSLTDNIMVMKARRMKLVHYVARMGRINATSKIVLVGSWKDKITVRFKETILRVTVR